MLVSSEASPARPDLDVASKPPCYWCRHSSAPPKDCVAAEASASRLDAVLDLERAQGVERRRLPGPGGVDTVQRLRAPARDAERHDRPDMAPPMRERFHCGRLQSDRRARSVRPRKAGMASPAGESKERASWQRKRRMGAIIPKRARSSRNAGSGCISGWPESRTGGRLHEGCPGPTRIGRRALLVRRSPSRLLRRRMNA